MFHSLLYSRATEVRVQQENYFYLTLKFTENKEELFSLNIVVIICKPPLKSYNSDC